MVVTLSLNVEISAQKFTAGARGLVPHSWKSKCNLTPQNFKLSLGIQGHMFWGCPAGTKI